MEQIGHKGEQDKSFMGGAMVIQRVYEKDGIMHIEAYKPRAIQMFIQRMTISKTGAMIHNGKSQN